MNDVLEPALYLVATPIGNMEDLTPRAARVLKSAHIIACEDTRHSAPLLMQLGANGRRVAVHDHNEDAVAKELVAHVAEGRVVALISDAGTPLVSDPGFPVVQAAIAAGVKVVAIPGASAALSALVVAGLSPARFMFVGFLPDRPSRRTALLASVASLEATLIFYAPARDLPETLTILAKELGDRQAAVCRELTKLHEEVRRGPLLTLATMDIMPKGEAVVVVDGATLKEAGPEDVDAAILAALAAGEAPAALSKRLAQALGMPRKAVYDRLLALKPGGGA